MMKNKCLSDSLILIVIIAEIITFCKINEVKVKAESNGWININNSWRYYSGPTINTGWTIYNGSWYYLDDRGAKKTGWIKSEGKWYYLDTSSGKMITGWSEDNGNWYYLNNSGEMRIGWFEDDGNLYYLNNFGIMVKDIYIDSYYLSPNGICEKGTYHNRENKRGGQ